MRQYRWFAFATSGGIPFASGPHNTESEAQDSVYKLKDVDTSPEIRRYKTVQLAEAKKIFKYEMSQRTGNMGLSLRPIRTNKVLKEEENISKGVYD